MKRLPIVLLSAAALTFAATGCKNTPQKSGTDSLSTDSVANTDTLVVDSFGYVYNNADSTIECVISVDYPRGDDSLSQAVKAFIGKELCDLYLPYGYGSDENLEEKDNFVPVHKEYPNYKGSVLDGQKMIDYYGKGSVKFMKETMKDLRETMDEDDYRVNLCCSVSVRKAVETPTYITYYLNTYTEMGGPHGSYTWYAVNISKLTNKPIEKAIDSSKTKAIQSLLVKGIEQYFNEDGEGDFKISDLYTYLDPTEEKPVKQIPLPALTPYIEKDSLCFVYQQYEIAPYSAGLVSFNIALKDIKPYLRKEVLDLIENKK